MANDSQGRSALSLAVQQHDNKPAATLVSSQFARVATANFTPDPELDEFPVNTADGSITATMKAGRLCYAGKAYTFRKKSAANTLTIAFSDSETFEGASTISVTDDDAVVSIMWDPGSLEWVRATAAGVGGDVPAGVAAVDFSNVTPATGRTALGVSPTTAVDLKADTHAFGPFVMSIVAADADKIRFRPGFAGTITAVVGIQTKGTVATGTAIATVTTTSGSPTSNTVTHNIADAANQVRTASPAGANAAFGATDFIDLSITGTNDGAGSKVAYMIHYTRT